MLFTNRSRLLLGSSVTLLSLAALVGKTQPAKAIDITFDYTYDTNEFFTGANAGRQNLLDDAASYFEGFTDQLSPVAEDTYDILTNPSNVSQDVSVTTAVAQNEIKIYVGSDVNLSSIGLGGPIMFGSSVRGQTGAPASDVEPVIGFISFKDYNEDITDGETNDTEWHFGTTTIGLSGKNDFLSTAIHEIAHVMGFGTSESWDNLVSGSNQFLGTKSNAIYDGNNVPLTPDSGHWQEGIESQVKGLTDPQETAMDPTLTVGERKFLTDLDYAGLQDIGWEVNSSAYSSSVPFEFSPSWGILVVAGMFGTKKVWNARKVKQSAVE